jgi:hypothetical protein
MKQEKIEVIEIAEKEAYLVKSNRINTYNRSYLLNGNIINELVLKEGFVIDKNDKLQVISKSKELIYYKRENELMSVEEYKSKNTFYDSDSSEEETLRAIANKKKLKGYEPIYVDPKPIDVECDVVGFIIDTGSKFIESAINCKYSDKPVLFYTDAGEIAMDEYNKLRIKYSEHAMFEIPDRNYLRFVKINDNFVFSHFKPFGNADYRRSFTSLDDAKKEEAWARNEVKSIVEKNVFNKEITKTKKLQILDNLRLIKRLKTLKSKDESIDVLIKDLSDYLKYTE